MKYTPFIYKNLPYLGDAVSTKNFHAEDTKVVNGAPASPGEFPFLVYLKNALKITIGCICFKFIIFRHHCNTKTPQNVLAPFLALNGS
jgi:hypothetical protein